MSFQLEHNNEEIRKAHRKKFGQQNLTVNFMPVRWRHPAPCRLNHGPVAVCLYQKPIKTSLNQTYLTLFHRTERFPEARTDQRPPHVLPFHRKPRKYVVIRPCLRSSRK